MKHNVRQRVINEYGLPVVKIEQVQGELGSGLVDCNGKEMFEGDKVRFDDGDIDTVIFEDGGFYLKRSGFCLSEWNGDVEVVGHAEE